MPEPKLNDPENPDGPVRFKPGEAAEIIKPTAEEQEEINGPSDEVIDSSQMSDKERMIHEGRIAAARAELGGKMSPSMDRKPLEKEEAPSSSSEPTEDAAKLMDRPLTPEEKAQLSSLKAEKPKENSGKQGFLGKLKSFFSKNPPKKEG